MIKLMRSCMTVSLILLASDLNAQTTTSDDVLINGDNGTVNLKVTGNNGSLFTGTFGSGSIPVTGAGTRMMWYPKKAAFRVGAADNTEWDDSSIGEYSIAGGYSAIASGSHAVALGSGSTAYGEYSTALNSGIASGYNSLAAGVWAMSADGATAIGTEAGASGYYSVAIGNGCGALADNSVALGTWLVTTSKGSIAIGHWNVYDYSEDPDSYIATDSLLIVGNGESYSDKSNALVMKKNANMRTGGKIEAKEGMRAKPLGDLSMGAFTAGTDPSTLDAGLKYSGE